MNESQPTSASRSANRARKWVWLALLAAAASACFVMYGRSLWVPVVQAVKGTRTIAQVIDEVGDSARSRLQPAVEAAGLSYPPKNITFLAIKDEAKLELWAESTDSPKLIKTYRIQAASGEPGPKLEEGDRQVPEGLYNIEGLNPNSSYHLSLKLNYPNSFDLTHAKAEGRTSPGSIIFIHGKAVSIGCLAMGDSAIEELFVLVADMGRENANVIIAPKDPRQHRLSSNPALPWTAELYDDITAASNRFR